MRWKTVNPLGRRQAASPHRPARLRRASVPAVLAALLLGAASAPETQPFTDLEIARAVDMGLMSEQVAVFHDVDVTVVDGVVTLAGRVDSLLDVDRALAVARSTKGVRAVVERLEISAEPRPDPELEADLRRRLGRDPALEGGEIRVRVTDGRVRLTGVVDSWTERRLAVDLVKAVPGLREIDDALEIEIPPTRLDAEILEDVRRRLASDVRVDAGLIEVAVEAGRVTLRGVVGSAAEREQAQEDAWVAGVRAVDVSNLEVRWWARDRMRRRAPVDFGDEEIGRAVRDALTYDPRVSGGSVEVSVEGRVVTLGGTATSAAARAAAEEDARNTLGAVYVRNHIKVRSEPRPSDAALADRVAEVLAGDPYLAHHGLSVLAERGRVVLGGTVDSRFDVRRAVAVAGGVRGVREVRSRLTVAAARPRSDRELQAEVRDALFWEARVDETHLEVRVRDGVATLRGWVDDAHERQLAADRAYGVGASEVRNRIEVRDP